MTREEAIDVLQHNYPSACFTDLCEAVDMAIKALSAQPRQTCEYWDSESNFCALCRPYAQPEIVRCRDCKHWTNNIGDSELRDNYCNEATHGFYYRCSGDDFCSYAERRTDGRSNQQTGGD